MEKKTKFNKFYDSSDIYSCYYKTYNIIIKN